MKCDEVMLKLLDMEDGEPAVREHLQGCETCRAEQAALAKTWQALDAWPSTVTPAPDFVARVVARAEAQPSMHKVWLRFLDGVRGLFFNPYRLAGTVAALLVAVYLIGVLPPHTGQEPVAVEVEVPALLEDTPPIVAFESEWQAALQDESADEEDTDQLLDELLAPPPDPLSES